jgi:hypothetical protein
MVLCPACGASLSGASRVTEIENALTPRVGGPERVSMAATVAFPPTEEFDSNALANPFDFDSIPAAETSTTEVVSEFDLGEGPQRAWRKVYRGLGLVTVATLLGPSVIPVAFVLPFVILFVGALGIITVEDLQTWLLPTLLFLLWLVPLAVAVVRTVGVALCVAAPPEAGVQGVAIGALVVNVLLVMLAAITLLLATYAKIAEDPTFEIYAAACLIPFAPLSVVELVVFLVFLLRIGTALRRPELRKEVIRFFAWLAAWIICDAVLAILIGVYGNPLWLSIMCALILMSFLMRYFLVLRTARGVLLRLFRLNVRAS